MRTRPVAVLATLIVLLLAIGVAPSTAADPAAGTVSLAEPQASWTGGPLLTSNGSLGCEVPASCDEFELTVDTGGRDDLVLTISIESSDIGADIDLIVEDADGNEVASSRSSGAAEAVRLEGVPSGVYTVIESTETATSDSVYAGIASLFDPATELQELPPAADPQGLEFSASIAADIQRDEGEPIIEVAPDGTIYTCGPTGTSQGEDYAQVSLDGGDQFHLLGEPPRGQTSLGGGGDCALATAPVPNAEGHHNLAYVGLSALVTFTTARSADSGRTFEVSPTSESQPGVDRQWTAFSDVDTVFLNYNQVAPRAVTVQRSDDAGLSYGLPVTISPNPGFPGPIRSMPPGLNPAGNGMPVVYYPWTEGNTLRLAVSLDEGATWNNCTAATPNGDPGNQFPVADHDREGNIYIGYISAADFNAYLVTAPNTALLGCTGGLTNVDLSFDVNPGFSQPALVNRGDLQTVVFPWIAAGGEPGRVAFTFYGSKTPGRPDDATLTHTWHVYVNQSLNGLSADPDFSQVRATTHPMHYDQICLLGLGCSTGGDRSLVDFFAIEYNEVNGELVVVYNTAHKRPGDVAGILSTPVVIRQIAGPSNGGGTVARDGRVVLGTSTTDPEGDALADFSSLFVPPQSTNIPALDLTAVSVGPAIDPTTGAELEEGGFTVTMNVADLSSGALQSALQSVPAQSLLWIFRYVDGYTQSAASARWNPLEGFTFGHNGLVGSAAECGAPAVEGELNVTAPDQCLYYPGRTAIQGAADPETGTIRLTVPLSLLSALDGQGGNAEHPQQVPAVPGDRIYDAAVYTQANVNSPRQESQGFLIPLDNSPAMDLLIPGGPQAQPEPEPTASPTPEPRPSPLPATGGGVALVGLLSALAGLGALRRRTG